MKRCPHTQTRQRGAALIVALLMLIVLLMLGTSAVHIGLQSEKMSRNRRDRQIAWQAAEAALLDAEYDIGNPHSPRYPLFGQTLPILPGSCGGGTASAGICRPAIGALHPLWHGMIATDGQPAPATVAYGRYSGRFMQSGDGTRPAFPPHYLIEILASTAQTGGPQKALQDRCYRISAIGFGPDQNTRVMLQSVFRRASAAGKSDISNISDISKTTENFSTRLSWREIFD